MKRSLWIAVTMMSLVGCTLPVPKTHISYQPGTKALVIQSPKDVQIGKVEVLCEGTNFTLTISEYKAENNVEVVRAAAAAQKVQIKAAQDGLDKVIAAAAGAK